MNTKFAQRAKEIVAKGGDKKNILAQLDALRREQFDYESSINTDRELDKGIEVEKEHKPTLDFVKKYYKENGKFPTINKVAKSIAIDHIEDSKKNPNMVDETYYKGLIDRGLSDEVSQYAMGGFMHPMNIPDQELENMRKMATGGGIHPMNMPITPRDMEFGGTTAEIPLTIPTRFGKYHARNPKRFDEYAWGGNYPIDHKYHKGGEMDILDTLAIQGGQGSINEFLHSQGGGLSRKEDYGSKKKPYPSVKGSDFAGGHRSYPIPTRADAVDALRLAGLHGRSDVRSKVYAKYPELKKELGGRIEKRFKDGVLRFMKDGGPIVSGELQGTAGKFKSDAESIAMGDTLAARYHRAANPLRKQLLAKDPRFESVLKGFEADPTFRNSQIEHRLDSVQNTGYGAFPMVKASPEFIKAAQDYQNFAAGRTGTVLPIIGKDEIKFNEGKLGYFGPRSAAFKALTPTGQSPYGFDLGGRIYGASFGDAANRAADAFQYKSGGTIHIKPENRGKFTATKKATGKTTEELTHSKNPLTRKRAIFAQNARKWHHEDGGMLLPDQQVRNRFEFGGLLSPGNMRNIGGIVYADGNPLDIRVPDYLKRPDSGTIKEDRSTPISRLRGSIYGMTPGAQALLSPITGAYDFFANPPENESDYLANILPGVGKMINKPMSEAEQIAFKTFQPTIDRIARSYRSSKAGRAAYKSAQEAELLDKLAAAKGSVGAGIPEGSLGELISGKVPKTKVTPSAQRAAQAASQAEPQMAEPKGWRDEWKDELAGAKLLGAGATGAGLAYAGYRGLSNLIGLAPEKQDVAQVQPTIVQPTTGITPLSDVLAMQKPDIDKYSAPIIASKYSSKYNGSDEEFQSFLSAISGQESGGDYSSRNKRTGASGKYQIMPGNWPSWAEEAGLPKLAPMTPENQEKVAAFKLKQYYDKYGPEGAAKAWYAGEGSLGYSDLALNRRQGYGKEPSINEYASNVLKRMGLGVPSLGPGRKNPYAATPLKDGEITEMKPVESLVSGEPAKDVELATIKNRQQEVAAGRDKIDMNDLMRYSPVAFNAIAGLFARRARPLPTSVSLPTTSPSLISAEQLSTAPVQEAIASQYRSNLNMLPTISGGSGAAARGTMAGLALSGARGAGEAITDINARNLALRADVDKYNASATDASNRVNLQQQTEASKIARENLIANQQDLAARDMIRAKYISDALSQMGQIGKENWSAKLIAGLYGYDPKTGKKLPKI